MTVYRYVWKINLYDLNREQEFLDHWKETSEILQTYPGAAGTLAHKVRTENDDVSYFLIASWESRVDRDAMSHDIHNGDSERAKKWRSYAPSGDFGEITMFAGEEIDRVHPES